MQHAPRYDTVDVDPLGLKSKLAMYANSILSQMWHSSVMKEKIIVGKHKLECSDDMFEARYTDGRTGWHDGVHTYGRCGMRAYTDSLLQIIKTAIPTGAKRDDGDHSTCPQASFRNKQKKTTNPRHHSKQNLYTVPVSNQFDILGN